MNPETVTVIHGTDRKQYAITGKTVGEAVRLLDTEVYGGSLAGLAWLVNGRASNELLGGENYILVGGDNLSFLTRGGDKG